MGRSDASKRQSRTWGPWAKFAVVATSLGIVWGAVEFFATIVGMITDVKQLLPSVEFSPSKVPIHPGERGVVELTNGTGKTVYCVQVAAILESRRTKLTETKFRPERRETNATGARIRDLMSGNYAHFWQLYSVSSGKTEKFKYSVSVDAKPDPEGTIVFRVMSTQTEPSKCNTGLSYDESGQMQRHFGQILFPQPTEVMEIEAASPDGD